MNAKFQPSSEKFVPQSKDDSNRPSGFRTLKPGSAVRQGSAVLQGWRKFLDALMRSLSTPTV
jgi:hypothetical protein